MNIVKKSHFKQNFGIFSSFSLHFQGFFLLFCDLILKILETNFVSYQKPLVSFCFVKKIELLEFVSRETSDVLLSYTSRFLFHVKQQQNSNTSRE